MRGRSPTLEAKTTRQDESVEVLVLVDDDAAAELSFVTFEQGTGTDIVGVRGAGMAARGGGWEA